MFAIRIGRDDDVAARRFHAMRDGRLLSDPRRSEDANTVVARGGLRRDARRGVLRVIIENQEFQSVRGIPLRAQ